MASNNNNIATQTTTDQERELIDLVIGATVPTTPEQEKILENIERTKPGTQVEIPQNL